MTPDLYRHVDRALGRREVGARLAEGPWQALPGGRWGVPAVAYMSLVPLGDRVLACVAGRWRVAHSAPETGEEYDQVDLFSGVSGINAPPKRPGP